MRQRNAAEQARGVGAGEAIVAVEAGRCEFQDARCLSFCPSNDARTPHTYVTDRLCFVISGTWWVNSGENFEPEGTVPVPAGGFVRRVAHTPHYDGVKKGGKEPAVIGIFHNSDQRSAELLYWLHRYNWHRPHGSLKANTPISRLGLSEDNVLRLHS